MMTKAQRNIAWLVAGYFLPLHPRAGDAVRAVHSQASQLGDNPQLKMGDRLLLPGEHSP